MKIQFALAMAVVLFSLVARADFHRLTNLTCLDEAGNTAIVMDYDSAISPYGPKLFQVYGEEVTHLNMELADQIIYRGMAGTLPIEFTALNKKKYQSTLMMDNSTRKVNCTVKTKFRL